MNLADLERLQSLVFVSASLERVYQKVWRRAMAFLGSGSNPVDPNDGMTAQKGLASWCTFAIQLQNPKLND